MRIQLRLAHFLPALGLVVGLGLALAAIPAAAQSSTGQSSSDQSSAGQSSAGGGTSTVGAGKSGAASQAPVTNPAIVPGEPQIIMPQVILKVEDLSVETVEAQLPPEEDLLPPVRPVPLLTEGELGVGEPTIPAAPVETEGPGPARNQRLLSSDIRLGAGTLSLISGSVSLKTLGPDPRFSLAFHHETLDGFAGNKPGSGFNTRTDALEGGLKFGFGGVTTDLSGTFKEDENGLQGRTNGGSYTSALSRTISGSASFSGAIDWLTLTATAAGGLDSLTMQGQSPQASSEVRIAPSLTARAKFGAVKIGLDAQYAYRSDWYLGGAQDYLHRVRVGPSLSVELPANFLIQGSVAWFANTSGLSTFPFSLSVTGTPVDFLTLSLEGGLKVVPYDAHQVLVVSDFAQPTPLSDDHGWYGAASAQLSVTRELSATVTASFFQGAQMPIGSATMDAATGLFAVTQRPGTELALNGGVRWGITPSISLSGGWNHEFLDRPLFTPIDQLTAGILGIDPAGRFGGGLTAAVGPAADGTPLQPLLHVSAFWRIIDQVKLQLDADDLLAPLVGSRWNLAANTYVTPGFRLSLSLGMSL